MEPDENVSRDEGLSSSSSESVVPAQTTCTSANESLCELESNKNTPINSPDDEQDTEAGLKDEASANTPEEEKQGRVTSITVKTRPLEKALEVLHKNKDLASDYDITRQDLYIAHNHICFMQGDPVIDKEAQIYRKNLITEAIFPCLQEVRGLKVRVPFFQAEGEYLERLDTIEWCFAALRAHLKKEADKNVPQASARSGDERSDSLGESSRNEEPEQLGYLERILATNSVELSEALRPATLSFQAPAQQKANIKKKRLPLEGSTTDFRKHEKHRMKVSLPTQSHAEDSHELQRRTSSQAQGSSDVPFASGQMGVEEVAGAEGGISPAKRSRRRRKESPEYDKSKITSAEAKDMWTQAEQEDNWVAAQDRPEIHDQERKDISDLKVLTQSLCTVSPSQEQLRDWVKKVNVVVVTLIFRVPEGRSPTWRGGRLPEPEPENSSSDE